MLMIRHRKSLNWHALGGSKINVTVFQLAKLMADQATARDVPPVSPPMRPEANCPESCISVK
jgi:hypothetical protein